MKPVACDAVFDHPTPAGYVQAELVLADDDGSRGDRKSHEETLDLLDNDLDVT